MSKPVKKDVVFDTVHGDTIEAVLIPSSIGTKMEITYKFDKFKEDLEDQFDNKVNRHKKRLVRDINNDLTLLQKSYTEAKVVNDLNKLGDSNITQERIDKLTTSKKIKELTDNKTFDDMINELAEITVTALDDAQSIYKYASILVWYLLRDKDDTRKKVFTSIEELEESISETEIVSLFTSVNNSSTEDNEDELKK